MGKIRQTYVVLRFMKEIVLSTESLSKMADDLYDIIRHFQI
ncbi:hypothetical protein [Tepidibacillus fermentans]|uniref:Uncharacterized protein n=1 Tax=Tepidibacillus fermentans TaxID=1281767 RepID=A0A4V2UT56_9BACI|nr:hypothetical protein [Tepidibacillus fermentans]TCS84209.1 hypothetical protein EDD72_102253 [Tepidibacillus fermentans]